MLALALTFLGGVLMVFCLFGEFMIFGVIVDDNGFVLVAFVFEAGLLLMFILLVTRLGGMTINGVFGIAGSY